MRGKNWEGREEEVFAPRRVDKAKIERAVRMILEAIGEDPNREGLRETPARVARMYEEIFAGVGEEPQRLLKVFTAEQYDELILLKDIPLYSICLHGKTMVYTPKGAVFAKGVLPGDRLLTLDPNRKCLVETEVLAVSRTKHRERYRVFLEGGTSIVTTGEHPFYEVRRGFLPARSLRAGDCLLGIESRRLCRPTYPVPLDYSLGYVLGALASDGYVDDRRRLRLEVNNYEFAHKFARQMEQAWGVEARVEEIRKPSGFRGQEISQYRVPVRSSYLAAVVEGLLGGDTHAKSFGFPEVVLHSRDTMQGFWDGYIDGDGHHVCKGGYHIGHSTISSNPPFLERLSKVLDTPIQGGKAGIGSVCVSRRWYQARNTAQGFRRRFPPEPQGNLLEAVLAGVTAKEHRVVAVQRESTTLKPYTMYNFECSPHKTFLANGVLVSNCEHHLLPFIGVAHVAYIPRDNCISGVSKIARVVDTVSRKPQVQERLTVEIADAIVEGLNPQGVIVVVEAEHLCLSMRGVRKPGAKMFTSVVRGLFRTNHASRDEALKLMGY